MRILILGDSLPAPRPKHGQVLEKTWPMMLKQELDGADVWQRAHPRSCILDVRREFTFFTESLRSFDGLVIQTGIVDCAPRPYPRLVSRLLELFLDFHRFRKIDALTHRNMLWLWRRSWVSLRRFEHEIAEIIATAYQLHTDLAIVFIPIITPTRRIAQELPPITERAAQYNAALQSAVRRRPAGSRCAVAQAFDELDPLAATIADGHHLSCLGHQEVARKVAATLRALLRQPRQPQGDDGRSG